MRLTVRGERPVGRRALWTAAHAVFVLPGKHMERVTLRIPKQQIDRVEQLVERGEYPNRSEAIRAAVRHLVDEDEVNGQEIDWATV